ncbi:MAG: PIN domain nuclease [Elusimicrobia bacterium]|nr:PIN domain nuclease [Elusimicrobiota bacterium]
MIVWIFRAIALLGTPVLTYFTISKDMKGAAFGLIIGLVIIGIEYVLESINLFTLIIGIIGAVVGIIISKLMDYTVFQIDSESLNLIWLKYTSIIRYALALLGMMISIKKIPELDELDKNILSIGKRAGKNIKVLDIAAIVDGRIMDICETHFITGGVVTPRFIVSELHTLADSQEPLMRAKGRRGLDVLARLQESKAVPFRVLDRDMKDIKDNTIKLVQVAKELGASIVTTDFNINKLAALENVTVMNIHDLSIALKPAVLPGEDMSIFIMKEGKEKEQGVGYLDDGTMIVVEDGREFIGKKVDAIVQSILQTSQGRIIFTRVRGQKAGESRNNR